MELAPGTFYLFCPKAQGLGALFGSLGLGGFGRSGDKSTQERIGALIR
jgi:hypothetical protein